VNLVPRDTSIAELVAIQPPSNTPWNSRVPPVENTLYRLRNVQLSVVKLETDSDYHFVLTDGTRTMIVEIPFVGCVGPSSPFHCLITHARAQGDTLSPATTGRRVGLTVTVVGVGFFDAIHTTPDGQAPNGIELHPVLALCFGADCTP
jgi:hypothetical protein